jgi:predicted transcriptional regulator
MGEVREAQVADRTRSWSGNYLTIQRFMVRDLHLSGAELMSFAAIHGFAQATGTCTSPLAYFRFWSGCCKTTAMRAVAALEVRGLVKRGHVRQDGQRRRSYRLTPLALDPPRDQGVEEGAASANATVTLYGYMVSELGLSGVDLVCYAALAGLCQLGGSAEVSVSWLASWCSASADTARRALRRLEASELIRVEARSGELGTTCNRYSLGPRAVSPQEVMARGARGGRVPSEQELAERDRERRRRAERESVEAGFQELRAHVPNTDYFECGRHAYADLLSDGVSHEEVVRLCDAYAQDYRSRYPEREARYLPRCERFLTELRREAHAGRVRPATPAVSAQAPRERIAGPAELVRMALTRDTSGRLGREAYELNDACLRAKTEPQRRQSRERLTRWCEERRGEILALASGDGGAA